MDAPNNDPSVTALNNYLEAVGADEAKKMDDKFWSQKDVEVERVGTKITLPASPRPMDYDQAIDALQRKKESEEQEVDIYEEIDGYPFDSAIAFVKSMQKTYGWATPVPTPGFFGPSMPDMQTVRTGPNPGDTVQVPIGSFKVPGVENRIQTVITRSRKTGRPVFAVVGQLRNKERNQLMNLVELARAILINESIYKGKALRMKVDDDGDIDESFEPEFLHTEHIKPEELILSDDTAALVKTALFTPITNTAECLAHGIPLKRGVLLEGPYGTGKSMTAATTSKLCVDNGWTFIHLDKVQGLEEALLFAQRYQPAVVFAEDIDRVLSERDEDGNDLLNTIDGVLSKNAKVITVLTTNFVEKIDKAMLRPGRLDAVVSIQAPDAAASQRLVRLYARGLLGENEPLDLLGEELAGQIPATIREVVERSKLAMIGRGGSTLLQDDLVVVARGMKRHLELLNGPSSAPKSAELRLGEAFRDLVEGRGEESSHLSEQMSQMEKHLTSGVIANILEVKKMQVGTFAAAEKQTELLKEICENTGSGGKKRKAG